ncbi:hypothetical protein C1G86_1465 [Dehalococcoides mccartyi]|uniref:Uncharacterized protein n=1 Tax=Dehalococcoides mccartyi TaxID=61435 RepID=A0A328EQ88_9CHLR|nr:hypothetical protein C1G86_1465 [Dehalococcoides mccartyi]
MNYKIAQAGQGYYIGLMCFLMLNTQMKPYFNHNVTSSR